MLAIEFASATALVAALETPAAVCGRILAKLDSASVGM